MITRNLRLNQLSPAAYSNYLAYLQAIDSKNIEAYANFLADDITVQFNNDEPMRGKETVLQGLGYYWQSFGSVEHDLSNIYGTDRTFVLEAENHYIRRDGKMAAVKAVAFTDLNDQGLVQSVRIYQDVSPVFA